MAIDPEEAAREFFYSCAAVVPMADKPFFVLEWEKVTEKQRDFYRRSSRKFLKWLEAKSCPTA